MRGHALALRRAEQPRRGGVPAHPPQGRPQRLQHPRQHAAALRLSLRVRGPVLRADQAGRVRQLLQPLQQHAHRPVPQGAAGTTAERGEIL